VREALFSILEARGAVRGARVLDLYAGTGALGIEALSRGAEHATFVEAARPALAALHKNLSALGIADRARVIASRVERAVTATGGVDLVLCDPPYADLAAAARALELVVPHLGAGTLVLEHASRDAPPEIAGLEREDTRIYGDTALSFYARPMLPDDV
jgi:16S rRNA (guanine966-N2)-methyltransferase